jgi:hypothetical protein
MPETDGYPASRPEGTSEGQARVEGVHLDTWRAGQSSQCPGKRAQNAPGNGTDRLLGRSCSRRIRSMIGPRAHRTCRPAAAAFRGSTRSQYPLRRPELTCFVERGYSCAIGLSVNR